MNLNASRIAALPLILTAFLPHLAFAQSYAAGTLCNANSPATVAGAHVSTTSNPPVLPELICDGTTFQVWRTDPIAATNYNMFLGTAAGAAITTGINNTALGYYALNANSTGCCNTAVGYTALQGNLTGTNNIAIGSQALSTNTSGNYNVAIGADRALYPALYGNTTGSNNVAIGSDALAKNSAKNESTAVGYQAMMYADNTATAAVSYNTAVGAYALQGSATAANNTGTENTAVGHSALYSNTSGHSNIAVGRQALFGNTTGTANIAIGLNAMYTNTTGVQSIAIGNNALFSNVSSNNNIAIGYTALYSTTADGNTAVGYQAGYAGTANTTGTYNTFIGYAAQANAATYTDSTALGANAIITGSNQVRIGDAGVTSIGGPAAWTNTSDRRLKKDIADSDLGLAFIQKLHPVSFRMKDGNEWLHYGFIAQEVEKALVGRITSMVTRDGDQMGTYRMAYTDLIAPLVKAVQEQQKEIEAIKAANAALSHELATLRAAAPR